ncbi:MAG TPA: lytic transglycosylase [Deltaproteobacteria bacterium]|nr:lytic transglycosylase [Deltaproteobacteria bacterium]
MRISCLVFWAALQILPLASVYPEAPQIPSVPEIIVSQEEPKSQEERAIEQVRQKKPEPDPAQGTSNVTEKIVSDKERNESLTDRVRDIADSLSADEEESLRDPFATSLEDLESLTVPVEFRAAVDHYIVYFTTKKRKMFGSWLKRAKRYTPLLKKILREHGLPEDLVYLAMIESGFNPKAYSLMAACGPWQFISATGKRYGLRIDHWVDERRDFEKATVAAARYLKDLFERFDCWYLAASGYNAGEGRIEAAIRRHNTSNYWEIYRYNTLPRETRQYVPQLIAAAAISKDPERYGFADPVDITPFHFKKKKVPGGTPLHLLAEVTSSDLGEIESLNPELKTHITPPGKNQYIIKLPLHARLDGFDESLRSRLKGKRVIGTVRLSSFRRRSLSNALKRYGTTREDLTLVNQRGKGGNLFSRRVVYIPLFEGGGKRHGAKKALSSPNLARVEKKGPRKNYRIVKKRGIAKNHRGKTAHYKRAKRAAIRPAAKTTVLKTRAKGSGSPKTIRTKSRKPVRPASKPKGQMKSAKAKG